MSRNLLCWLLAGPGPRWAFWMLAGFLAGGVMFSQWLPRRLTGHDVTAESPDHNPGTANVFLVCGIPLGLTCLALDLLKGFVPVALAKNAVDWRSLLFAGVMVAPVLGHAMGVFNHGRGGKCIATSFGVLAALLPGCGIVFWLAGLYILFSTLLRIRPVRWRSRVVFGLFGVLAFGRLLLAGQPSLALGCAGIAAIAYHRHRAPDERPAAEDCPDADQQPAPSHE